MQTSKQLTEIAENVNCRFFEAIDALAGMGQIHSLSAFCKESNLYDSRYREMRATYGISRKRNTKVSRYKSIEIEGLYFLITKYSVSAEWLLTGKGKMFGR